MKIQGIKRAEFRLRSAETSLRDAEQAEDQFDFQRHWSHFLSSMDAIYNCFGQSLGGDESNKRWFSDLSSLRRSDPLLQYLTQARNADNHGIDAPAERKAEQVTIGGGRESGYSREIEINFDTGLGGFIRARSLDGKPVRVLLDRPSTILRPVTNRGVTFAVPTRHLNEDIGNITAIQAGRIAVEFFEAKLVEAWQIFQNK